MAREQQAATVLTIDLDAIRANYRLLRERLGRATCAAVLKANAYGLGAAQVGPALAAEGCRDFFVAHLDEGIALRPLLPVDANVYVLHGPVPGSEADFPRHHLIPVLNSLAQIAAWRGLADDFNRLLPAIIQVDTGMSRLGLATRELLEGLQDPAFLAGVAPRYLMSHLACAEDQSNPMNAAQLASFMDMRRRFPACAASLANSSGIFLGPDFHFDLARPGAALFGVAPIDGLPNPMQPVVRLQAGVIQIRTIEAGQTVGYGASYQAPAQRRIATVAAGYADGWLRSLSNRGFGFAGGVRLPIVGTVSMDTCAIDVTALPEDRLYAGMPIDLICPEQPVDAVAAQAGTIGYEILTSLGARYRREYIGNAGASHSQDEMRPSLAFN